MQNNHRYSEMYIIKGWGAFTARIYLHRADFMECPQSAYLEDVAEEYKRKHGCYPAAILADKIYQNRLNHEYCKAHGIRLSGPALG